MMLTAEQVIEEWRPVVGYEGFYEVSSMGRIRSVSIVVKRRGNTTRKRNGKILLIGKNTHGYLQITLCRDGLRKNMTLHRAVMMTFSQSIYEKPDINHINGNKRDNRLENLEWVNDSENCLHAWKTGLYKLTPKMKKALNDGRVSRRAWGGYSHDN